MIHCDECLEIIYLKEDECPNCELCHGCCICNNEDLFNARNHKVDKLNRDDDDGQKAESLSKKEMAELLQSPDSLLDNELIKEATTISEERLNEPIGRCCSDSKQTCESCKHSQISFHDTNNGRIIVYQCNGGKSINSKEMAKMFYKPNDCKYHEMK